MEMMLSKFDAIAYFHFTFDKLRNVITCFFFLLSGSAVEITENIKPMKKVNRSLTQPRYKSCNESEQNSALFL